MGAKLRGYVFDDYLTKKKPAKPTKVSLSSEVATAARKTWKELDGISDGVLIARDLVNQPTNKLGTIEFTNRAKKLSALGVKIQVLGRKRDEGVENGGAFGCQPRFAPPAAPRPSCVGMVAKPKTSRLLSSARGVVFDTGGISIKPSGGMEDMKGDMGGAAAVTGLMHALASRKAKTNVVGISAWSKNMPDGDAQRPGDIVKSMSGQTIEIINTDAERSPRAGRCAFGIARSVSNLNS